MSRIHAHPDLVDRRRELRRTATPAERLLWSALRGRRDDGLRFKRQHSIGPFVVDFYCAKAKLAIELDGQAHDAELAQQRDAARDAFINRCGVRVIRIPNDSVKADLDAVVGWILEEAHR